MEQKRKDKKRKMSAVVGTFSASKQKGFNKKETKNDQELRDKMNNKYVHDHESDKKNNNELHRENDGHLHHDFQDENQQELDEEDYAIAKLKPEKELDLGPQFSLKEQLEMDKDDESLRKWKEQLLGSVDMSAVIGESKEPDVKILSLSILCPGCPDIVLPIPFGSKPKRSLFILKEGSRYCLKFCFTVSNNIVSGLKYKNTVWKTGVRVDNTKMMLGTFSPQKEPYTYELEEETTPSGLFARGSYSARTKFVDDDGKAYLDISYNFEIQKNWPSSP